MKNAQLSIEYIATYGWVFLGILITIGAMSYYGAFNLDRYRIQDCSFAPGLICEDFAFDEQLSNALLLYLRNDYGVDIEMISLNGTTIINDQFICDLTVPDFGIGEVREITCNALFDMKKGVFYEVDMKGSFKQKGNNYLHNFTGKVQGRAG